MEKPLAPWEVEYDLYEEIPPGHELIKELAAMISSYVELPDLADRLLALWVIHTYSIDRTRVNPLLYIYSPQQRCGKTTLLSVLSRLVNRPMQISGITAAALYRTVDKWRPTLLLDEADSYLKTKSESSEALRGIINSCWSLESAWKSVCVGKNHRVVAFPTFTPIAIAGLGRLEKTYATIADRSIIIQLERKLETKKLSRLSRDDDSNTLFDDLRSKCATWVKKHGEVIGGWQQPNARFLEEMDDRTRENYEVLLAISKTAMLPDSYLADAYRANKKLDEEENVDSLLLKDINDIFESMDKDFVPSGTIVARLEEREDRPWGTWSYGQPMTKHALARRLKNYGIAPSKKREGQHTVRGYYRDDNFKEKLKRYCQVDVEPTQTTQPSV